MLGGGGGKHHFLPFLGQNCMKKVMPGGKGSKCPHCPLLAKALSMSLTTSCGFWPFGTVRSRDGLDGENLLFLNA
jgi:hypothetical protein